MRPDIASFIHSLDGGGAERAAVRLVNEFARLGYTVDLVLQRARGPYLNDVAQEVTIVDLDSELRYLPWRLRRYLNQQQPASLLSSLTGHNVIASLVRPSHLPRLVVTEQNSLSGRGRSIADWQAWPLPFLGRIYNRADQVIAVAQQMVDELAEMGVDRHRLLWIPNPIDSSLADFVSPPRGADSASPLLVGVGRLVEQKDFITLIRAFGLVRNSRDCRLIILGEGPQRSLLESTVSELGLQESVELPGFVSPPWTVMSQASALVMSSKWEGWPCVLVEAMALGVPVVATDCPTGPREILNDGRLGPLVPPGNPEALANAIIQTIDEPIDPAVLQTQAAQWSIEQVARSYLNALLPSGFPRAGTG